MQTMSIFPAAGNNFLENLSESLVRLLHTCAGTLYGICTENTRSFLPPSYDSVWVLGKTILETDSIDPLTVRDAITDVAATHTGTIGTINLNEFGDFAAPSYDLWSIRGGQWYVSGHFDADSGTFSFT